MMVAIKSDTEEAGEARRSLLQTRPPLRRAAECQAIADDAQATWTRLCQRLTRRSNH